jgi:hypothetical protein
MVMVVEVVLVVVFSKMQNTNVKKDSLLIGLHCRLLRGEMKKREGWNSLMKTRCM